MAKTVKTKQSQAFIDKAKEIECDKDESAFEDKLRRIATVKNEKGGSFRAAAPALKKGE